MVPKNTGQFEIGYKKSFMSKRKSDWPHLTDLFVKYRAGDVIATTELFENLEAVFQGFYKVRMSNHSDIQDMVQTTLLKVHFGRDSFNELLSLKTWIFTIANRALIDHWRSGVKGREHMVDMAEGQENIPEDGLQMDDLFEIHSDLEDALDKLKPFDRTLVYLYGVEGMSMGEIAAIHNSTEGAVKVRVHRAMKELKTLLVSLIIIILSKASL